MPVPTQTASLVLDSALAAVSVVTTFLSVWGQSSGFLILAALFTSENYGLQSAIIRLQPEKGTA